MRIIDRFSSEHEVFLQQLDAIAALRADAPLEALIAAVRTLSLPLLVHAENEERSLFPDLEATLGPGGGPIAVLVNEHLTIHRYIEAMTDDPSRDELLRVLDAFAHLLREHIAKEEEVLFPMAERVIGDERLVELDAAIPREYGGARARA